MRLFITCLLWFSALGCGVLGGVYFAFSTFIMSALSEIGPPKGVAAMNSIDVRIQRSLFMPLFASTTLTSLARPLAATLAEWTFPILPAPIMQTPIITLPRSLTRQWQNNMLRMFANRNDNRKEREI